MKWKKLSPYAIACNNFTISKAIVKDGERFTLWHGDRMVQIFKTPQEAKSMAEKEVESV